MVTATRRSDDRPQALQATADAPVGSIDQRAFLHDLSWTEFEALLAMRGDRGAPRLAYLEGEIEIMSPSAPHEHLKTLIGRLLETWAGEMDVRLEGFGSETLKSAPRKRGAEPDECYRIGDRRSRFPDLAIEVVWTSGGLDKLEIYRGLGVREVWVWSQGDLQIHVLRRGRYVVRVKSEVLPTLDLVLFRRCLGQPDQTSAVRELRRALRAP